MVHLMTVTISAPQKQAIESIVTPERARFDERERRVYSHDTGVLPGPFRLLAGPSLADGVVQPETEDQVVRLVRESDVPRLVPHRPRRRRLRGLSRGAGCPNGARPDPWG